METVSSVRILNTLVILGSARNVVPPWGGVARLGDRVLQHVVSVLESRETVLGTEVIKHATTVIDPLTAFGPGGALCGDGHLSTPHFFLKPGTDAQMDQMANTIRAADCYAVVTPEYNHSIPPALTSLMGHFGGSNYALKPSAIVTYSPGPFGGMRCAMALRPFLSELGCLPISKLAAFPNPAELFRDDGTPTDANHRMLKQLPSMLAELEWMATAMQKMRHSAGPPPRE